MKNFDLSATTILCHKDVPAFQEEFQTTLHHIPDGKVDRHIIKELIFSYISRRESRKKITGLLDPKLVNRALIFRYDALGDYVLTTPVPRLLKALNPQMKIDIITSPRNKAMVSANPLIDHVYTLEKPTKNFNSTLIKTAKEVRQNHYDVIFGLVFHSMTVNSYLAAEISPSAEKITMRHKGREALYGRVFNRQIEHSFWREHYTQTMCRTVTDNFIGAKDLPEELFQTMIYLKNIHFENIAGLIAEHNLKFKFGKKIPHIEPALSKSPENNGKFPYIIFNLTSTVPEKKLDPVIAAGAINLLAKEKPHVKFFVTAAPSESEMIDKAVLMSGTPNCYPVKLPINEFIAFMSGAAMLFSPDTGTVHIAAALGLPQVTIYISPQSICEWTPFDNEFYAILTGDERDVNIIKPEMILETALKFDRFNEI